MIRKTALMLSLSLSTLALGSFSFAADAPRKAPTTHTSRSDAKADTTSEAKSEAKSDSKSDSKTDTRPEMDDSFAQIAKDLNLTGKGQEKYEAAVNARQGKLDAWKESDQGKKLADARKELSAARKNNDEAKVKSLQDEIEPLNAEYAKLRESTRADVLGTLSEKQQTKLLEIALARRVTNTLDDVKLTSEQEKKIAELCDAAVPDYLKEHPIDKDPYFRHLIGVQTKLLSKVKADVLTDTQRDALKSSKKDPTTKPAKEK